VAHSGSKFREATLQDVEPLLQLARRTYYETFAAVNTPGNMDAYLSSTITLPQLTAELSDPRATFYVAEIDGGLIGYAKLHAGTPPDCVIGEGPIELVRLYVDRPWQGHGVAATLMNMCLTAARKAGFKTMYLGVWEKNHRAQAFYRKWEFVPVGAHIFQMGDDPQIDFWMMRPL
jgi:GNAT superfamily N-acetyltransferase